MDIDLLIQRVVAIAGSYRGGGVVTIESVELWIDQYGQYIEDQEIVLSSLISKLERYYLTEETLTEFFQGSREDLAKKFDGIWSNAEIMNDGDPGKSQDVIVSSMLPDELQELETHPNPKYYVYYDDAIYTGNTILKHIRAKVDSIDLDNRSSDNPIHFIVYVAAMHIETSWGREYEPFGIFLLRQFLKERGIGLDVLPMMRVDRSECYGGLMGTDIDTPFFEYFPETEGNYGPFGLISTHGLAKKATYGFGSPIVTYRNCPNGSPVGLWKSPGWNPLFPRVQCS